MLRKTGCMLRQRSSVRFEEGQSRIVRDALDNRVRRQNRMMAIGFCSKYRSVPPPATCSSQRLIGEAMNRTILCIDDADPVLQLYGRLFEEQGYKVILASNAWEGWMLSSTARLIA